jgi:hypothetical protein
MPVECKEEALPPGTLPSYAGTAELHSAVSVTVQESKNKINNCTFLVRINVSILKFRHTYPLHLSILHEQCLHILTSLIYPLPISLHLPYTTTAYNPPTQPSIHVSYVTMPTPILPSYISASLLHKQYMKPPYSLSKQQALEFTVIKIRNTGKSQLLVFAGGQV